MNIKLLSKIFRYRNCFNIKVYDVSKLSLKEYSKILDRVFLIRERRKIKNNFYIPVEVLS